VTRVLAAVLVVVSGCATVEKKPPSVRQAEHGLPAATEFPEGAERAAYSAAHAHEAKGDAANGEPGRAEWAQAGEGYAALAERPAVAEWRVPLRHRAAELLLRAQRWERAGQVAAALVADAHASEVSKAVAARLAATAALGHANAQVRAGQLEKLDLALNGARKERPPASGWKRVVDATDAYLARSAADPEARKAAADRRPGPSPADLALVAAEVQYAHGDLDGARGRLEAVMERWPAEGEVLEQAVPVYLATFLGKGDRDGHDAAVERLRERIAPVAAKAGSAREKEAFAKVQESLARARAGARFGGAERLLAQGKPADAAQAFEAVAAEPGVGDPANALHNAAVAWDRAGDAARAAKVRERILRDHPASAVAAEDALALAAHRSRAGDHLAAARLYEEFLSRWPKAPNRCLALRNAASELDVAGRAAEAAGRYLAFGGDAGCAKDSPDVAARALVRAGHIFEGQAKQAYGEAARLPGVTDPEARGMVGDAKKRLKRM
jgi:tetratricopeptide (TPR) repeat protein